MGLVQNGYRHNLTGRIVGATNLDGANPYAQHYQGHIAARNRNCFAGTGITDSKAAVPNGNLPSSAWIMPRKAGGMSSRAAEITLSASASGLMGMPGVGSAAMTFSSDPLVGQLIVSGAGSAAAVFGSDSPVLTASINGIGSAAFSMGATGALGALADMVGEAAFAFDGEADILPEDDTSPLREGTASFSMSGSLTSYAIGHMEGTTDVQTELTADGIASSVWNATASQFNETGTMGNKLNTASSGGVDLDALAEAVWESAEADYLAASAAFLQKIVSNKRAVEKEGTDWVLVIYDDDGTTPILTKVLKDKTGSPISDLASGVLAAEEASSV